MNHIETMKQALDALDHFDDVDKTEEAIKALRAAIAQGESEPTHFICHGHLYTWPSEDNFCGNPEDHILLYAAPQVADYVPLSDDDIIKIAEQHLVLIDNGEFAFARAIERAVRGVK